MFVEKEWQNQRAIMSIIQGASKEKNQTSNNSLIFGNLSWRSGIAQGWILQ